jgi:hypothetical protein
VRIGLVDSDLLDNGTRHPNLALMKISGYMKDKGYNTELLLNYKNIQAYDEVFISKVFTYTKLSIDINQFKNIKYGGTGFFKENSPNLDPDIEHHMPDYHLYDVFISKEIARGLNPSRFTDYLDYSIGFSTRGCFRKCPFCVNKKYESAYRHSKISEFFDPSRKHIYLWDDNFLAYGKWNEVLDELECTGRSFQFRQGLDIRLMTEDKASRLSNMKYKGDFIFAFDSLEDKLLVEEKLKLWRKYCQKTTKLYVLCAYESQDIYDIISVFERIKILIKYKCLPYIMRYEKYKDSRFLGMYINLARWCNQPNFFKKKSFREFCEANQNPKSYKKCATLRYMEEFEHTYPDIAKTYFDMKFEEYNQKNTY